MTRTLYFITHPNVVVDPSIPVPGWSLSDVGRRRMSAGLRQPWIHDLTSIYCSTEKKAVDGAEIIAARLAVTYRAIEGLGENDRSATGFLESEEFECVANEFFARPNQSVRGWERAVDAQRRITEAVTVLHDQDTTSGSIAIVSHGAVGTLLYCWLAGLPIARQWDQPSNGGGNYYAFTLDPPQASGHWQRFDPTAATSEA